LGQLFPVQDILEQLDKAISQKEKFKNDREAVISQIKQRLNYATDNTERYKLCGELFNLYLHYQADSAFHYIRRKNTTTLSSLSRRETSKFPSIGLK